MPHCCLCDSPSCITATTGLAQASSVGRTSGDRRPDAAVGKWISEDPIGFAVEDTNLVRYVGQDPPELARG